MATTGLLSEYGKGRREGQLKIKYRKLHEFFIPCPVSTPDYMVVTLVQLFEYVGVRFLCVSEAYKLPVYYKFCF